MSYITIKVVRINNNNNKDLSGTKVLTTSCALKYLAAYNNVLAIY